MVPARPPSAKLCAGVSLFTSTSAPIVDPRDTIGARPLARLALAHVPKQSFKSFASFGVVTVSRT